MSFKQYLKEVEEDKTDKIGGIINDIDDIDLAAQGIYDDLYADEIRSILVASIGEVIAETDDVAATADLIAGLMQEIKDKISKAG